MFKQSNKNTLNNSTFVKYHKNIQGIRLLVLLFL